jgi:1-acyl-sn-glycerol-3-phosphate acyltransferase
MHFMAKSELFKSKLFALVIKAYGAFPITRDSPDRAALRHSVNLLLEGDPVVIFPEGRTSPGEGMLPLQPGMAMLARTPGVQTICLGLRGVNKILPFATLKFRKGGTVWARWGHPKVFTEADSTADILAWARAELEELRNE